MTVSVITLNNPSLDIEYTDALMALDKQVRDNNASPYLYPQDRDFYYKNLAGETINVVAKTPEQIIGYTALRKMAPWPEYLEPVQYPSEQCALMLFNMVHPQWRGQGIGKRLNMARMDAAASHGFNYLYCTTHPDNVANFKMLRQLGFEEIAQKPLFSEQLLRSLMFLDLTR